MNQYCNTFLPTSIWLLNARLGRGKRSGRRGECNGNMSTTGTTIINIVMLKKLILLCCVNVNVYHVNFPFAIVKGYGIVLHFIVL